MPESPAENVRNQRNRRELWYLWLLPLVPILLVVAYNQAGHSRPIGHGDISFDISPSGEVIVFSGIGSGGRDLFLLDLRDSKVTRIAETPDYEVAPTFTPDGRSIVYAAGRPGDRADHLFIRPLDGGAPRQLTAADANDSSPRVSPDGTLIAFDRCKTYNWGGLAANWSDGGVICVIGIDGKNERQITPDETFARRPWFLPDGLNIAYLTFDGTYLAPVGPNGVATRISDLCTAEEPSWSPDGEFYAYLRSETRYAGSARLFVTRSDGSEERLLTPDKGAYSHPRLSPDGRNAYFFAESWPQGPTGTPVFQLWTIGVDERGLKRVAGARLFEDPLHWVPEP